MFKRIHSTMLPVLFVFTLILSLFVGNAAMQLSASAVEVAPEIRAVAIPAISAPFTTHPTVFIVEDTYQIAFATNATGISWVEIGGVKYENATTGLMNWNSKYHKITVPQSVLNQAASYTICFRALADRPSYDPAPGTTVSRTYPFSPMPEDRDPVFYCSSDQHGSNDYNLKVSTYKDFDVYVCGGDFVSTLTKDSELKFFLDVTGSVTQGCKPTIYTRGNHEIRGSYTHNLEQVSGFSESTGAYYRVEMPGIFGLVLDAGEDKVDSHEAYGGTTDYASYRKEQTKWLQRLVESREWEKYPIRMAFCHVPFSYYATGDFESIYKEWTELLDQMGISLMISGHTHKHAIQGPYGTRQNSSPNYTVLIVSDRENGDYLYSGTFVTASKTKYTIENVLQDVTLKSTKTIPVFTNAYVRPDTATKQEAAKAPDLEVVIPPATKATVPSIASPYTLHPTVFAVEDSYQIIFTTDATGMAWVEVGGTKYRDTTAGNLNWASKYHKVNVPRVALDSARSYKLCFRSLSDRPAYYPAPGSTVSRTYPFTPIGDKTAPVLLCLSDFRGLSAEAQAVAAYKTFDALYVGGDYAYNGNTENNIKTLLSSCSTITTGTKPVIYTRGNREVRGAYSYLLQQASPTSSTGRSYYTVEQTNLFAIVLDSGEDKLDSHTAYGSTIAYEKYRKEQTQWLKEVVASGKWKDYPTRIAFCHMPFTTISTFKADYAEWTELLDQMGVSLLISGNSYSHNVYQADNTAHLSDPSFGVVTVCDVDNATYKYSGSFITLGDSFKIESVSAAKKLLKTSTVSNLTASQYWKTENPYLLFDFNNDPVAAERYHSSAYGGINFDVKTNWAPETNTAAPAISRGALSFSPASATVTSSGIMTRAQGSAKGQWAYRPLHYMTKATDYCQVRFKIDNAVSSATDGTGIFRLDVDCPNDVDPAADTTKYYTRYQQSFKVADVVGKGYTTLTFPLNSTQYLSFNWMNLVHPQFVNLKSADGSTAVFSLDYIYIGPQESLPQQDDHLFFDFTDTEADRERYDSFTYNHLNFDDPTNWTSYSGSPLVSISDGALRLAVTTGNTDGAYSARSRGCTSSTLHYVPGREDYLQVRVRIEDAVAVNENGIATFVMYLDRSNTLVNSAGTSRTWTNIPIDFNVAEHVNKGWFILETKLTDAEYLASDWINVVHPQFKNIQSANGKTAAFYIDSIYIGPQSGLPYPMHTVTFVDAEGKTLLTQAVRHGDSAIYSGSVPTQAYDATYHYSFKGWDKALDNITADTTIQAQFTATAHSLSYTKVDSSNHKASCSCGYSASSAHTWDSGSITTQPTCTATGVRAYTCTGCKDVKTEALAVLGHSYSSKVTAPTCTTEGYTTHSCSRCSNSYKDSYVAAKGHKYVYTPKDEETHLVTCENCSASSEASHSFVENLCICGQENMVPVLNNNLKMGHTLNLASDISVNYAVAKSLLEGFDMSTVFVLTEMDTYEGTIKTGTTTVKLLPVEQGNYYYFTLNGLTAVQMNDRLRSVLYGTKDSQSWFSPTDDYSIAAYAYSQMNKDGMPESLKILCADLLRYGASAQVFKNYRTNALATAAMTTAQKAYLSNLDAVTFGSTNSTLNDVAAPTVAWAGKALDLASKVTLKFMFDPTNYSGKIEALSLHVSYLGISGQTETALITGAELYNPDTGLYAFSFDGLLAAELRSVVSVQIYEGSTPVSCTLQYSADTYGNNKTGTLGDLCKALFAYSDSAKAYFR